MRETRPRRGRTALLRRFRRRLAPRRSPSGAEAPPRLLDAWSGAEVNPGQALPEPYGAGHVVFLGPVQCTVCGAADRPVRVAYPHWSTVWVHLPEEIGTRWSDTSAVDRHNREGCRDTLSNEVDP